MKDIILNLQSAGLQRISRGVGIIFFRATLATGLPGDPRLLYSYVNRDSMEWQAERRPVINSVEFKVNGVYFYHSHRIMKDMILNLQSAGLQRISRGAGIIFFIATLATKLPGDPRLLYS